MTSDDILDMARSISEVQAASIHEGVKIGRREYERKAALLIEAYDQAKLLGQPLPDSLCMAIENFRK